MPLAPTNPIGNPEKSIEAVDFAAVATAGNDLTTEVLVVGHDSYVTAARLLPAGNAAANATNFRTWALVDATTIAPTDGCIVDPTTGLGPWALATAYTAGQWVVLNNLMYVCISGVTGGTGPGVDTTHWQQIAAVGKSYVNTLSTKITADYVGAAISDSGNTDIPASSFVFSVQVVGAATAIGLTSVAPVGGLAAQGQSPNAQPSQGSVPLNPAIGTVVQSRTFTVEASKTLASFASSGSVSLATSVEQDLTLSTTDTKVYKGDLLTLTSVHTSAGVADPGGVVQVELTSYEEGTG